MIEFPEPPKSYGNVFLEDTDKPLPEKIDPRLRYTMFSTIAKGGKSLIKSCRDLHLSRFVCYKSLRPEFQQDPIEQTRLLREARVSAMLQHPNTVPTYEVGRDSRGHYYFTMKLVHGYTLREILNFRERYDLTQLVDVVVQILHALDYAHSHGVAHRDIKPENILVGPFGEVVLLDWGLAKVWGSDGQSYAEVAPLAAPDDQDLSMTGKAQLQGTVCYMSPEQVRKDPDISFQTDLYSIGAVLYELLCGRTPFVGEKVHHVVRMVTEEEPQRPSEFSNLKLPALLEELAMQCLQKDASLRPQTAAQMVRLLQEDWRSDLTS
ncbi:MAG: serine/threonine-protein kinase [Pseudomonadota bacterium]